MILLKKKWKKNKRVVLKSKIKCHKEGELNGGHAFLFYSMYVLEKSRYNLTKQ